MAVTRDRLTRTPSLRRVGAWVGVLLWGSLVTALHVGGLQYDIYTQVWWWDLATHAMSGAGVAAAFYLFRPEALRTPVGLVVVVPAFVLGVGAGFEVYEYLFKDFWHGWSTSFYLRDTVIDLLMDLLGAYAFVVAVGVRSMVDDDTDVR